MKTLYIVRHAKAVSRDKGFPDFGRSLVTEGVKTSKKMIKKIKQGKEKDVIFVSSPANRALETAHIFAKRMDYPVTKILLKDVIYESSNGKEFLTLIQGLDDAYRTCFLFGHDPSISEFAASILTDFKYEIPKAGIVCVEFGAENWKSISKNNSSLKFFQFPLNKTQKEKYDKKVMKDIRDSLIKTVDSELRKIDAGAVEKIKKDIKKQSKKIALAFMEEVGDYYQLIAESELKFDNDEQNAKKPVKKEQKVQQPPKAEKQKKSKKKSESVQKSTQPAPKAVNTAPKQTINKNETPPKKEAVKPGNSNSGVSK
ncbi:hypothetical protein GF337_02130 [candidate division KSB1 bacterium]|nr:hypothetical protein [candidate division KSB1 bacterium]